MSLEEQVAEYDLASLPDLVAPVIIDAGAHVGTFSLAALRRWPGANSVLAYEPHPENFRILSSMNPFPGELALTRAAIVHPAKAAEVLLYEGLSSTEHSLSSDLRWPHVRQDLTRGTWVPALDAATLPPCDVLKIDTEGAEVEILEGYRHLDKVKVLLVEAHAVGGDLKGQIARIKSIAGHAGLHPLPSVRENVLRFWRPAAYAAVPPPTKKLHITVTSTVKNAPEAAAACVRSVRRQTYREFLHVLVAVDDATRLAAQKAADDDHRFSICGSVFPNDAATVLANLLHIWRGLPDDEIVAWLDGDDELLPHALERVLKEHEAGAEATYGQFLWPDGRIGFAGPVGPHPRSEPWRATHLKTFRAGLVKRMRDSDFRDADGSYANVVCDQRVMLGVLELAPDKARFIAEPLYIYNEAHSFEKNATAEEKAHELAELKRVRAMEPYEPLSSKPWAAPSWYIDPPPHPKLREVERPAPSGGPIKTAQELIRRWPKPRIISVTLARNSAETVEATLRSAFESGLIDQAIVIDTGSTDDTLERAIAADPRVLFIEMPWPNSFSVARNEAFRLAHEKTGAEWGVMLDSDEILSVSTDPGMSGAIRAFIMQQTVDVLICLDGSGAHYRERIFRFPLRGKFEGPTHEAFICESRTALSAVTFHGQRRSDEEMRIKRERDVKLLEPYVKEHPNDSRWHFYLADSYWGLGRLREARDEFWRAANSDGWDEERAVACFRAATLAAELNDFDAAIRFCGHGLSIRPDTAECAWYAAYCWSRIGNWDAAILCARICETIVHEFPQIRRTGFRFFKNGMPPAETWGPSDILRFAYRNVGRNAEADEAKAKYQSFFKEGG